MSVVETISGRLAERGHESVVYTTDTGGPSGRIDIDSNPITRDGVSVYYFRNLNNHLAYQIPLPIPIGYRSRINKHIGEFDAVHIHGYPHLLAVLTARAAQKQSIPYIISPHGSVNLPEGVSENRLRQIFERTVGEYILSNADTVVALTEKEEQRLYRKVPLIQDTKTIPNGINPDKIDISDYQIRHFREKYGFENSLLVIFVGRLTYKKGIDVIWKVADQLDGMSFDGSSVQFGIIGPDDGMREKFENYVSKHSIRNVSILGYLSEENKNTALAAGDIFILPSYSEGQPISVLEACAAGTPVIVSEQCSIPEIVGWNAGRVIPSSAEALERDLRELLSNSAERNRCARNAAKMVREKFSWEKVINELELLYQSV